MNRITATENVYWENLIEGKLNVTYSDIPSISEDAFTTLTELIGEAKPFIPHKLYRNVMRRLIPAPNLPIITTGWLGEFLQAVAHLESPTPYWVWAGLTLIGSMMGRKSYFPQGAEPIFPNLSSLLIGPPGQGHKSTVVNFCARLAQETKLGTVERGTLTTKEFCISMSKVKTGRYLWSIPELGAFLNVNTGGKEDLLERIIDMMDCPDERDYKTANAGKFKIKDAFLTILGASNEDLMRKLKLGLTGGLLSRFIMIHSPGADKPEHDPDEISKETLQSLAYDLKQICSCERRFKFSPSARKLNKMWYDRWFYEQKKFPTFLSQYTVREPQQVKRIAMILTVNNELHYPLEFVDEVEIPRQMVAQAISLVTWARPMVKRTLVELIRSPTGRLMADMLDFIQKSNPTPREIRNKFISLTSPMEYQEVYGCIMNGMAEPRGKGDKVGIYLTQDGIDILNGNI